VLLAKNLNVTWCPESRQEISVQSHCVPLTELAQLQRHLSKLENEREIFLSNTSIISLARVSII